MPEAEKREYAGLPCGPGGGAHHTGTRAARGLLVVCAGDSAHLRRDLAAEVPIGGRGMRIIVIKLPACISRFLLRLRGGYEPE